jgi:hypothetical protein
MGGSVFREDAGQGFAAGGAPRGDDVLAQINALVNAHQGMFPYGKAGMYGSGMGKAGPYGSTLMQPGSRGLMTAPPVRQEAPYNVRQAMRDVKDITEMPKTVRDTYSGIKGGLLGTPGSTERVTNQAGETITRTIEPTGGLIGHGGRMQLQGSYPQQFVEFFEGLGGSSGNARGGAIRPGLAMGGMPYSEAENEYVPEDISKPMTPQSLQPSKTPQTDPNSDMKTVMDAAKIAAMFASSDRRLKDNIEPIGKLFDGQNVYRYNFKGDDKKQIGLMAQEVEKRYPDAVGLAPRKGYEVGGSATEESRPASPFDRAVNRTFGFEGGLNPRDSNGAPSNFGINQAANPDVNVRELTQDQAREIYRTRYWDRIGGDALAAQNPDLAHVAFDSAVIAGPNRTRQWLEQANGDVNRLLALREQHETELLRNDPDRFGPYRNAWASRRAGLAGDVNAGESATAGTLAGLGYPTQPRGGLEPLPGTMQ